MSEILSKVPPLASPPYPPLAHHDDFDFYFDFDDFDFVDDVDLDEEYVANQEILDKFVQ